MLDKIEQEILDTLTEKIYKILKSEMPQCVVIPEDYPDNELRQFVTYFNRFILEFNETTQFTMAISKGELYFKPSKSKIRLNCAIMNLHMSLRHLTWKTKQIANGDLSQKVDFLGEFSDSFNSMTAQLKASFEEIENQKNQLENLNNILELQRNNLENIVYTRTIDLQEALKRKEIFLQNVSHELRTPLNGIMGFCSLLLTVFNKNLDEQQLEYLNIIKTSSEHLLDLVNDLLKLTFYQTNMNKPEQLELDLNSIIVDTIKTFSSQLSRNSMTLTFNPHHHLTNIMYNKEALTLILNNLISNAIKYSLQNSEIIIKVDQVDEQYGKVSVSDLGLGVSDNEKEKIFEEFYKSEISITKAIGGTGIGLTICKKLVELHGGKIGVDNNSPQGSIFWFTFLKPSGV